MVSWDKRPRPHDRKGGALVIEVVNGSPADQSGLQEGDLIIAVDGSPVLGMSELAARIRLTSQGSMVAIDIVRSGEEIVLNVVLEHSVVSNDLSKEL